MASHNLAHETNIVRKTDLDALASRLSTHMLQYPPQDPYLIPLITQFLKLQKKVVIETNDNLSMGMKLKLQRELSKQFFSLFDDNGLKQQRSANTGGSLPRNGSGTRSLFTGSSPFGSPTGGFGGMPPGMPGGNNYKSPVINRGTWLRTASINMVIDDFLKTNLKDNEQVQIINLGAGNDTRCFNLLSNDSNYANKLKIIEIDFEESCKLKKFSILGSNKLLNIIKSQSSETVPKNYNEWESASPELITPNYLLLPADLRDIPALENLLKSNKIDFTKPTLFLSECCICYLAQSSSNLLLNFLKQRFTNGVFLIYDPIGGSENEQYGTVMAQNLNNRGIKMPCLMTYGTTEKQIIRFMDELGFRDSNCTVWVKDLKDIYHNWMKRSDIEDISRLEFLDEMEELDLINKHYLLIVASWGNVNFNDGYN